MAVVVLPEAVPVGEQVEDSDREGEVQLDSLPEPMARTLALANVTAVHSRAESFESGAKPFDTVVARAFAALPELLKLVSPLCGPQTHVLAMKGKRPDDEIAGVPPAWRVLGVRALTVPGLNEERHLVTLQRA